MNRKLIVVGTLALVALPSGAQAVEDTLTGEQLGEAAATVTPFRVGEDKVVFASPQETPNHARTVIVLPDERDGHPYPVKNGGWISQPVPYSEGMTITAIAKDDKGRELFRLEGPPIRPNADGVLRPMLGPSWTTYGPTVE
jgi:hypothetical protein